LLRAAPIPVSRKHDRIGCDETGFAQHLGVVHASERLMARGTFLSDRRIARMRDPPLSATLRPLLGKERATCGSPSAHAPPGVFWPSLVLMHFILFIERVNLAAAAGGLSNVALGRAFSAFNYAYDEH
jgi:hypothetical protein